MNIPPDTSFESQVRPLTATEIQARKNSDKICCMTAFDYASGRIVDQAGMDIVLVDNSVAVVALGYDDTLSLSMDEMVHHVKATSRGVKHALLVAEMPFGSYLTKDDVLHNGSRLIAEGNARAVKLRGDSAVTSQIEALVTAGIPVMGHLELTPQQLEQLDKSQSPKESVDLAKNLIEAAQAVEAAGAFCLILETIPVEISQIITDAVTIPTLGIGAGTVTDGQLSFYYDTLGFMNTYSPEFIRQFGDQGQEAQDFMAAYCKDVKACRFPGEKNTLYMSDDIATAVRKIKIKKKK